MSLHINRFLDAVRAAESRGQRDIHLTLTEARDLQRDITRLLLMLENLRDQPNQDKVINVDISGGTFRDS
jgi:hypothetical protein